MQKDGTNWILFGSKPKQKYLMRTFYDNSCFSSKFTSECIIFSSKYCMYPKSYFKSKPESVTLVIMNQNDVNFERKCPSLINKWPIWSIMDRPISLRKLTKVIILEFTKNFGHLGSFLVFFVQKFQKSEIFVEIMTSGTIMNLVFGQKLWFLNKIDILKNRFFVPKSFEIGKI